MKIQIASDLHVEMHREHYPPIEDFRPVADRDVLVLAGDIGTHTNALRFVEDEARVLPVNLIPGNHEYYSVHTRRETDYAWRQITASTPDLHYLDGDSVRIDGVRFWGGAWYSNLRGQESAGLARLVEAVISDFSPKYDDQGSWTVRRHLAEHARQTKLLRAQAGEVDVVVTHWPPIRNATPPRLRGDALSGYFVNDREDLVGEIGAQLSISGHVHDPYDCRVGETRCIGNPAGYRGEKQEVAGVAPDQVVEVSPGD